MAPSIRNRIFFNLQLFRSGFKNFPVHALCVHIKFARPHTSDGIMIDSRTHWAPLQRILQSMRHTARDSGGKFARCSVILVYSSIRDWTRFCYVIRFENIQFHSSTRFGFVADFDVIHKYFNL